MGRNTQMISLPKEHEEDLGMNDDLVTKTVDGGRVSPKMTFSLDKQEGASESHHTLKQRGSEDEIGMQSHVDLNSVPQFSNERKKITDTSMVPACFCEKNNSGQPCPKHTVYEPSIE